jgi:hypothetical protein
MSTLPFRIPHVPQPFTGFERVISAITTVIDVFAEAEQQASAAQKRYPFASW